MKTFFFIVAVISYLLTMLSDAKEAHAYSFCFAAASICTIALEIFKG